MLTRRTAHLLRAFDRSQWMAVLVASCSAVAATMIAAGDHPTPLAQAFAVLAGFGLLGTGALLALAIGLPPSVRRVRSNEDWTYW